MIRNIQVLCLPIILGAALTSCLRGDVRVPSPTDLPLSHETAPEAHPLPIEASGQVNSPLQSENKPALSRLDTVAIEDKLLEHINVARGRDGLSLLESDTVINWAARIRSREMLESYSHIRPDGSSYHTVFDEADFPYSHKLHGENKSTLSFPSGRYTEDEIAGIMFRSLASSPGNYRNMMRSQYALAGIGVSVYTHGSEVTVVSCQLFAGR